MSDIWAWAFHNPESGNVWLEALGRETVHLGVARTQLDAYDLTASVDGLVRVGNWLPAYGSVNQCRVTVPKDLSSSPTVD
jgi:hypothetical protein